MWSLLQSDLKANIKAALQAKGGKTMVLENVTFGLNTRNMYRAQRCTVYDPYYSVTTSVNCGQQDMVHLKTALKSSQ